MPQRLGTCPSAEQTEDGAVRVPGVVPLGNSPATLSLSFPPGTQTCQGCYRPRGCVTDLAHGRCSVKGIWWSFL